jgi:glycosyltransferase involved in cell wall biosynthesis
MVAWEAAMAGVPTIGTKVGVLAEWSPDAARVVAPADAAGMAAMVIDLARDEEARLDLARHAQQRAVAEDADVTAQRMRSLYQQLCARA